MSYLRVNARLSGRELDINALGVPVQNFIAGSSVNHRYGGGLIVGSFSGNMASDSIIDSAAGVLSVFYGATFWSNIVGQSGFYVQPLAAWNAGAASQQYNFKITFSQNGSLFYIRPYKQYSAYTYAARGVGTATAESFATATVPNYAATLAASTETFTIKYIALVISSPFG